MIHLKKKVILFVEIALIFTALFSVSMNLFALDPLIYHDISTGNLVISDNGTYSVSGTTTTYTISVSSDCSPTVILNGVNVDVSATSGKCAFLIAENSAGNVVIEIADKTTNSLKSGANCAGIEKSSSLGSAANMVGTLSINGGLATSANTGTLYAQGGLYAAAIGGGSQKSAGEIIINGGKLTTRSNGLQYNVGSGCASSIGGGGGEPTLAKFAKVTINGGYLDSTTGSYSAVIGTGDWNSKGCAYVTLNGGYIYVNNQNSSTSNFYAIGGGYDSNAVVNITGGTVYNMNSNANYFIGASYTLSKNVTGGSFNADVTSLINTSLYKCVYSPSSKLYTVVPNNYYTVTCFLDGNYFESYSLEAGSSLSSIEEPTMPGYFFNGWYSDIELSNKVDVMPSSNITVYGNMLSKSIILGETTEQIGLTYKYGSSKVIGNNITIFTLNVDIGDFKVGSSVVSGCTSYTALTNTGIYAASLSTSSSYRTLTLTGNMNASDLQSFLRNVTFTCTAGVEQNVSVSANTISLNPDMAVIVGNDGTTHYYEFVTGVISWDAAYNAAKTRTFNGLAGYLATITNQLEHDYIYHVVDGTAGWIGGMRVSSGYPGSFDTSTSSYTKGGSSVATDPYWYWMCGPEAGKIFFTQNPLSGGGSNYTGDGINYSNWNTGEPNANDGFECYAQYGFSTSKLWNDLSDTNYTTNISGYYVEYSAYSNSNILNEEETPAISDSSAYTAVTVSFNTAGGNVTPTEKIVIKNGLYGDLPTPTRSGYTFEGWYTQSSEGTVVTAATTVTEAVNHSLHAHWGLNAPNTSVSSNITSMYNGSEFTLSVTPSHTLSLSYTYQWYKNSSPIEGATAASYNVRNVSDNGSYTCLVTASDGTLVSCKTSGIIAVSIAKRDITIIADSATKTYDGTPLTNSGYSITDGSFVSGEGFAAVTVEGSRLFVGASSNTITAFTLNSSTVADNYNMTLAAGALTINKAAIEIKVTADSNSKTYDGTPLTDSGYTLAGSLAAGDSETVTVTGTITNVGSAANAVTSVKIFHGGIDVTENYVISIVDGTLAINKREITVTANSSSKTYDGTPLTNSGYSITDGSFVSGEGFAAVTVEGSRLFVGASSNTITAFTLNSSTVADNYNMTLAAGTLTINKAAIEIKVTADSNSKTYDGTPLTDSGYTLAGSLAAGDSETVTVTGTITNVGSAANAVTSVKIFHGGIDVTENYVISIVDGTLAINKREITVTANSSSKTYDGTPLTNSGYSITDGSFVSGEGFAAVTVEGSRLFVGTSSNTITAFTLNSSTVADNYNMTLAAGALTINKAAIEIKVTADSNSKTYDGTPLTDSGYTLTGSLAAGDSETVTVTGTITNVGSAANAVTSVKIFHGGIDVTENYVISIVDGTLAIIKREITVTANSSSKTYDGTPLTNSGYSITSGSLALGEDLFGVISGTITNAGSAYNNVVSVTISRAGFDITGNYSITKNSGNLTVSKRNITITANSVSKTYDGSAITDSGYSITDGSFVWGEGFISVTIEGSQVNAGSSPNFVRGFAFTPATSAGNYNVTTINGILTVEKAQGSITNISDIGKVSNGKPVSDPTYIKVGDGTVTVDFYSGNTKLGSAPSKVGTYTVIVVLADGVNYIGTTATREFIITELLITTKIETSDNIPAIQSDNFNGLFTSPSDDPAKGITEDEINNAKDIKVTLVAENVEVTSTDNGLIKNIIGDSNVGLLIDLSIVKKVTYPNGESIETKLTELNEVLSVKVPIPEALIGKTGLTVYRIHEGVVTVFETTPNNDGEYFEINDNHIILHSKYFSTYAVCYNETIITASCKTVNIIPFILIGAAVVGTAFIIIMVANNKKIKNFLSQLHFTMKP